MQTAYINQLFETYQIINYNTTFIPMIKKLYSAFTLDDFIPNSKDTTVYKQLIESVQWLAC